MFECQSLNARCCVNPEHRLPLYSPGTIVSDINDGVLLFRWIPAVSVGPAVGGRDDDRITRPNPLLNVFRTNDLRVLIVRPAPAQAGFPAIALAAAILS